MDPATISLIATVASSLLTNMTNAALSERQRSWNEQQQDAMNDYNKPINQMARLRDAGMSPMALKMGQGFDVAGNTSAPVLPYDVPMMLDPLQVASNSVMQMAEAKKARAEAKTEETTRETILANLKEEGEKLKQEINMLGLDARAQQIANDWADLRYEIATMKDLSEIGLNEAQVKNLNSVTDTNLYKLNEVLPKEVQLLVDKHELNLLDQKAVIAAIQKTYAETENIKTDTSLKQEQTFESIEKQSLNKEQSDYLAKQISLFEDTYEDVVTQVANETKLSNRQVKGFWINMVLHGIQTGAGAAGAIGLLMKGIAAM